MYAFAMRAAVSKILHRCFPHREVYTPREQSFKGEAGKFFMRRYYLFGLPPWFRVCIHEIAGEDTPHMHSHPWSYLSIVLKGRHIERFENGSVLRKPFSVAFRRHSTFHRLEPVNGPSWTLIVMGPRRHAWGFLKEGRFFPHESRVRD